MSSTGRVPVRETPAEARENEVLDASLPMEPVEQAHSLVPYLRLFWDHRKFLVYTAVYALLASILIALLIPVSYESTARLMPPDNQSSSGLATAVAAVTGAAGGLGGLGGGIASDILGLKSTSDIFVGILSSRTVQDKLIQQFDLKKLYHARRMEDARKKLAKYTDISVDRKSQIISITVTDHDSQRAAAMGRAYIAELNRLVAELSTSSARRERIFLEERLQTVNKDLESAEKDFSQFASKNTAIDIKEQGKAMVESAAILQGQLIAAESELEGLRQIYSDNNVRVRSIRARIQELKRQLQEIAGKGEQLPASSAQQADPLYPSIRQLPLLGVTFADLYRRTRVQEVVFETLTKEYEVAKVQEVKEIPVVKVLDPPNIPDKKSFPPRLLIVFLGTVLGLVMAATSVVSKTTWEQTDSADPRKVFAQEVFTTVKASLPKFSRNGAGNHSVEEEPTNRAPRRQNEDEAPR